MALDSDTVQRLLDQLAQDRQAFIENTNKTHDLLQQTLTSMKTISEQQTNRVQPQSLMVQPLKLTPPSVIFSRREAIPPSIYLTQASQRTTTADIDVESVPSDKPLSAYTGESDSETDDGESLFVQTALEPESYDMEGFRRHLTLHPWSKGGKAILDGLQDDETAVQRECIFPANSKEEEADRSQLSHYSIYDVGFDGVPLDIKYTGPKPATRSLQIWNRINSTNTDPAKRPAAGRIVIVREPSPKLFAALHYVMNKHFDVDEMFDILEHEDPALSYPHRAFSKDDRHRRTFVITMEYYTIIGEHCKPMKWQSSDVEHDPDRSEGNHIPISRCSSVIALSLEGPPMTKVRNRDRRIHDKYGEVHDPFSPWRVLSMQAYPDWHATTDTHKPSSHYVNGPEAFLYTVEAEFEDARKRLKEVYNRVSELVEPPSNFIFNSTVREALLFEDDKFTYSKRYFWAYQTLSIINSDITEMIESYRDTFRECVWDGTNKIIWPGESNTSSRYQHFRKRMAKLKQMMDDEVEKLEYIKSMNSKKMQDIEALRENLFSGTSVMESRRSVEQTKVTIEQNRSVLLLTLVTIFFLPLTFVTSVFGMTNMSPTESYSHLGWAVVAVCIPTYLFIGSMHTDAGLNFWSHNKQVFFAQLWFWAARLLALVGYRPHWARVADGTTRPRPTVEEDGGRPRRRKRSNSATRLAMDMRMRTRQASAASEAPLSPSLTPVTSARDRYIPRPQLTSGDANARVSDDKIARPPATRRRTSDVKVFFDRPARMRHLTVEEDAVSLSLSPSPRTASPGVALERAESTQTRFRGLWPRWWRKREDGIRDAALGDRPSV